MHELLVLARLRDAVDRIVKLFQKPDFFVAFKHTGNMVRDAFGELQPECIVLGPDPSDEQIEQWRKDVKQAFKEARQELASCRSLVTLHRPKFQVGYTKHTLEGFEENVLPMLAEIATSQHLHDYVEGLKQRRGELDSVLSDFNYESKTEAEEGKPNSPANVSTVERESLESEQPPLVPHPTEDTSAKAALNRLNRFVELMEATNARDEIEREQSYGREPSTELVETAKPWMGKDSIEELRGLAASLATEAEVYKCSEGGKYLSLVAVNYWQCHQRGHSATNAMMVRRTIAELKAKLLAAIRHEEGNQSALTSAIPAKPSVAGDDASVVAEPPLVDAESSQQSDAEVLKSLKEPEKKAWASWCIAEKNHAEKPTDSVAYKWIKEADDELFFGDLVDYQKKMPALGTWARYLRTVRKALKQQKHTPTAGRAEGRSIARKSDL